MKRLLTLIFILFSMTYNVNLLCNQMAIAQQEFIAISAQEWAHKYLPKLDAYQLQLLASNLHLLYTQASYTSQISKLQQQLLWTTYRIGKTNDIHHIDKIQLQCNELKSSISLLETIDNALEECNSCIETLDLTYSQNVYEALQATAKIGRHALKFYDNSLKAHSEEASSYAITQINELSSYTDIIKNIPNTIEDGQYKQLVLFYTLKETLTQAAEKSWNIIKLNGLQEQNHVDLITTCIIMFKVSFDLTHQHLMNQDIDPIYKTLLFVPQD